MQFKDFLLEQTKISDSTIRNLKRHVKEKDSGNIPYYEIPIAQAKILEREGYVIRLELGSIELTTKGKDLIKNS